MIAVGFLGTPGKCPYYSGASGFGLEVFVFGFPCFFAPSALYLRTVALTSRPCSLLFPVIAPVRLTAALTSFSRTARFIRVLPR